MQATAPPPANGWGGARAGAGRKPGAAAGDPVVGQRATLGQLLAKVREAPPASGTGDPPAFQNAGGGPAPAAPAEQPVRREENRSFARLVGYVTTNVGVLVIGDSIRKGGRQPNEPDDDDLEHCTEATAEGVAIALGDAQVPWWGALACAWGNLYLTMRVGARPLDAAADQVAARPAAAAPPAPAATSSPSPPPAPPPPPPAVLGQGVPARRPPPAPPPPADGGPQPMRALPEISVFE